MRCHFDRKNDLAQLCYVVTYIGNRKGYFKIYYVFFGEVRITLTISTVVASQSFLILPEVNLSRLNPQTVFTLTLTDEVFELFAAR